MFPSFDGRSLAFVLTLTLALTLADGQKLRLSKCPQVPANAILNGTSNRFDINKYIGVWYEIERTNNVFEMGLRCVTAEYQEKADGTLSVTNQGIALWGQTIKIEGTGRIPDPRKPNDLRVTFSFSPEAPYWIVDTDYKNYAVVVSCVDVAFGLMRFESMWVLSRSRTLPESTINVIHSEIDRLGLNSASLGRVTQTNCQ